MVYGPTTLARDTLKNHEKNLAADRFIIRRKRWPSLAGKERTPYRWTVSLGLKMNNRDEPDAPKFIMDLYQAE